jgi:hypothetical protein
MQMRTILVGAIVAAAAVATALFAAGPAGAVPDVVDRQYKDAKKIIQQSGGTPVIATRTGAVTDESNCLVTNAWDAGYPQLNSRGRIANNGDVLVALNCNGELAAPGAPGNSAMSPVGRDAKAEAEEDARQQEEQELAQAATPGA